MLSNTGAAEYQSADVRRDDHDHVLHPWNSDAGNSSPLIVGGKGSWFWDETGRRYLDFAAQRMYLALGHQHPRMIQAIQHQASKLCTAASVFACESRSQAAALIAAIAPPGMNTIFFTTGGSDAVEHAIRMARIATNRSKILSAYRSYHGATAGSLSVTGERRRLANDTWQMPGVVHFFGPYTYRSAFGASRDDEECSRALNHLENVIDHEGPSNIAAILLETIVGRNGVLVPPDTYLPGVRNLCDRYGILLVLDEIMTGFGRCGKWFAADLFNVVPDVITFGKGVNSGYVPLGGVILGTRVADAFKAPRSYPGGMTYSGHPLACAAAVETIRIFEEEQLLDHVEYLSSAIYAPRLAAMRDKYQSIGEIRGRGAFWAIELVMNRKTREPIGMGKGEEMDRIDKACRAQGLWPCVIDNRIQLSPPLNISESDLAYGLEVIDSVIGEIVG